MKGTQDLDHYLEGTKFSNAYALELSPGKKNQGLRNDYLAQIVSNKNVIHFGCVDHLPLIHQKIEENIWLHKLLDKNAARCFGVDNYAPGIKIMKKLGYSDLVCADIITEDITAHISDTHWNYLIMGEILEHVDDPVIFLKSLYSKYKSHISELIITVPNALRLLNFSKALKNTELINSDHRYWFTPYTLMKVVSLAGFLPGELHMVNNFLPRSRMSRLMTRKYPLLRETLILHAKF